MTEQDFLNYIQTNIRARASLMYPHSPDLQILYQLGFLQAQLARAMYNDTRVAYNFRKHIKR